MLILGTQAMGWPQATDYSAAVQNPAGRFRDAGLRRAQAATDLMLGLPLSYAGNFATVFKLSAPGEPAWAVKCFTRQVEGLQQRYQAVSDHLDQQRRKFAVEFVYLAEGIEVGGVWYPILKMHWVEGFTLNEFLRDHADQPALLDQLAALWFRLAGELREARMAHGDLQHGNVMLVPGSKSSSIALRLIDYDGMWVPELADRPPGEVGHANYQHPERLASGGYSAEIDRFSHLVIYTALRCLALGGRSLWDRYDNAENLLFRAADFRQPARSKLFTELLGLSGEVRALVGHLIDASQRPLSEVPLLSERVDGGSVVPLSVEQTDRLRETLPGVPWPRPVPAPVVPPVLPTPVPKARPEPPKGLTPTTPALPPPSTRAAAEAILANLVSAKQKAKLATSRAVPPPVPTTPQLLPWPPLPEWVPRLGLSPQAWPVRYWPVVLGVLLSLPGLALVFWVVLLSRLAGAR